jgi:hypothetical protein
MLCDVVKGRTSQKRAGDPFFGEHSTDPQEYEKLIQPPNLKLEIGRG